MEDNTLVVHKPEEGETLKHYLQRYTSEERHRIYLHETKLKELSAILVNTRWPREVQEESIEKGLENLWKIMERLNNFRRVLHFIELLDPVRRELLDALDNYGDVIGKTSKWCTGGRILASAVDTAGTIGGLCLVDAKPSCSNWALGVATFFGLLGATCSVGEIKISYDAFTYLMERIDLDQENLAPIRSWYQQSSELEAEILNIFPFDMTEKIVKEFIATGEDQRNTVRLLMRLLRALGNLMRNDDEEILTERLIRFVVSEQAQELCLSLFARRQHLVFDIAKMALQIRYSSWPFYICQSVAALPPRNQNAYSLLGRMGLNLLSIYDGISSIGRSTRHEIKIRQLKKHLECELVALQKIALFIRLRSRELVLE